MNAAAGVIDATEPVRETQNGATYDTWKAAALRTTRPDGTFVFEGLEPGPLEIYLSIHSPPERMFS